MSLQAGWNKDWFMLGSRMLKRMFYLLLLKLSPQLGWNEDRILPEGWMPTRFLVYSCYGS